MTGKHAAVLVNNLIMAMVSESQIVLSTLQPSPGDYALASDLIQRNGWIKDDYRTPLAVLAMSARLGGRLEVLQQLTTLRDTLFTGDTTERNQP